MACPWAGSLLCERTPDAGKTRCPPHGNKHDRLEPEKTDEIIKVFVADQPEPVSVVNIPTASCICARITTFRRFGCTSLR